MWDILYHRLLYVYKYQGHFLLELNHPIDLNHITCWYDHQIRIPYHIICIDRPIQENFRMLPIDKFELHIYVKNIARIANAVQVTICLLVSTSV